VCVPVLSNSVPAHTSGGRVGDDRDHCKLQKAASGTTQKIHTEVAAALLRAASAPLMQGLHIAPAHTQR
jgi:hypothetical protein